MKNLYFLNLLILCLALTSCHEDEEPIDSPLIGTWQLSYFVEEWEKDAVITMDFNSDGTMTFYGTVREPDSSEDLGYQFFAEGSFLIQDGRVSVPDYTYYTTDGIAGGSYVSKDELYLNTSSFGNRPFEVNADQSILLFPGGCEGDECFSEIEYFKVQN
ncbi:hypothetical protein JYB64_10390 [Algoriphagus aestuarii]|nr:hypothetical protein [Algoriphagus aestuarii]